MKIEIKGPIISDSQQWIYDWLEMPATSPKKVNDLIAQMEEGEDLEIIINSGGGSVFSGSEIYTTLKKFKGNIKGEIVGLAASAASVIAMGIKDLSISPTAQIMIHRASTYGEGNANDFEKTTEMLKGIDKSIATAYVLKTELSQNELIGMMEKETWLDAETALEKGFVNSIMFADELDAVASTHDDFMIPEGVIKKIQNKIKDNIEKPKEQKNNLNNENIEIEKAKLLLMCKI